MMMITAFSLSCVWDLYNYYYLEKSLSSALLDLPCQGIGEKETIEEERKGFSSRSETQDVSLMHASKYFISFFCSLTWIADLLFY